MNRLIDEQEQEHLDHVLGSASEFQNCFSEAKDCRRGLDNKQQAKIAEALGQGKFVVVDAQPYYCKATDAVAGEVRYFRSAHSTRAVADFVADQLCERDPEARAYVLPKLPVSQVIAHLSEDDVPF